MFQDLLGRLPWRRQASRPSGLSPLTIGGGNAKSPLLGRRDPQLRPLGPGGGNLAGSAPSDGGATTRDRFAWPHDHRTGDIDRGTRAVLRVSVFFNVGLLFMVLFLASSFSSMLPLRRDVPYFIERYDEGRSVINVYPVNRTLFAEREVEKREVANMVRMMMTITPDFSVMNHRWAPYCVNSAKSIDYADEQSLNCSYVYLRMSPQAWGQFDPIVKQAKGFIEAGKSRAIKLLGDPIRREEGVWEVRYEQTDYLPLRESSQQLAPAARQIEKRGKIESVQKKSILMRTSIGSGGEDISIAARLNPEHFRVLEILDIVDITE